MTTPDPTLHACHIDESAGMDPAVNGITPTQRAYAAADAASVTVTPPDGVSMEAWLAEHGSLAYRHGMAHAALAAALDVEEMARTINRERFGSVGSVPVNATDRRVATALRAAILGGAS